MLILPKKIQNKNICLGLLNWGPIHSLEYCRCQIPIPRFVCFHRRHDADFEVPNEALGSDLCLL